MNEIISKLTKLDINKLYICLDSYKSYKRLKGIYISNSSVLYGYFIENNNIYLKCLNYKGANSFIVTEVDIKNANLYEMTYDDLVEAYNIKLILENI